MISTAMRPLLLSISLVLLVASPLSWGQIYSWVDEKGKKHFGDEIPEQYKHQASEYEMNQTNTTPATNVREPAGRSDPNSSGKPNVIFLQPSQSTSCEQLKKEYAESQECFSKCRLGANMNIAHGSCSQCKNVKQPDC